LTSSKDGSGRGPAAPRVLLPKDLKAAPFTGRKDELQAIDQAFADRDQAQVFVLFGSPGVGKSRLAHEYATRHLARYPGGTFFLQWDGTPPSELAKLLASSLKALSDCRAKLGRAP
jgi:hypothetical protein